MASSTAKNPGFDEERIERIRIAIGADIERNRYDGCVLLVARRGRIAIHEAFGFAERATGRRNKIETVLVTVLAPESDAAADDSAVTSAGR